MLRTVTSTAVSAKSELLSARFTSCKRTRFTCGIDTPTTIPPVCFARDQREGDTSPSADSEGMEEASELVLSPSLTLLGLVGSCGTEEVVGVGVVFECCEDSTLMPDKRKACKMRS